MGDKEKGFAKEVKYLVEVPRNSVYPTRWFKSNKGKGSYELTFVKAEAKQMSLTAAENLLKAIPNSKAVKA